MSAKTVAIIRDRLANFQYWPHVITLLIVVGALVGYRYFAYYDTRSNDAYVSANVINIASLVSGPVSALYVLDNQPVKKGDKLIQIDSRPYLYALNKAKANLAIAQTSYQNKKLAIQIAEEKISQSLSMLNLSKDHLLRYQRLQNEGALPEIRLINVEARLQEQQAALSAANQELKMAQQDFDDNEVRAAEAMLHKAQYLYDHTLVVAPANGYITNFNLRTGQYVKTGEGLFALIETDFWWIVTRYRETAIRLIKPGDKAKIMLDMYPGKTFHGHVESIGWGINRVQSGSVAPSTLAYLEATEDWIKIAQRFPVRIVIDDLSPDYPLRIGASATTITYQ